MKPDDPAYVSAFNQIIKGATCRTITPKTGQLYKNRFDGDCSRAFAALTSIGLNVCTGWRGAACRRMSNTWECSALVPVSRGMEITRTLDSCGPNLPPPRDPRLRCFTGAGQTSGTRKRRHSPPALPVGSSKITRFNPGPPSAHQASGSSLPPGVPPYTEGFSVGSSSSSIPPFSQRATSSFDVTQITRLGISRDDLQSFANPSHVAQPTRLGTGGPSGVSGQVQSQGRGQSYSLGQGNLLYAVILFNFSRFPQFYAFFFFLDFSELIEFPQEQCYSMVKPLTSSQFDTLETCCHTLFFKFL
ncbi:unnamed protein product [Bemisia tabaci]|uniref:Uncharacterized protein n=1 Tax=Bemisia tabaci TaxID=7038 RepID=A0A9P0APV3_BEMTA|nr:unnamed protein product [Bemisia tabaci]